MDKKKILIAILIISTIILIWLWLRKKKTAAVVEKESINTEVFPLKKGSSGPEVIKIQKLILTQYDDKALPLYGADGVWGDETEAAVNKYLKRSSISLDYFAKLA